MAHHCGFTLKVLIGTLKTNGFAAVAGKRRPAAFELKPPMNADNIKNNLKPPMNAD